MSFLALLLMVVVVVLIVGGLMAVSRRRGSDGDDSAGDSKPHAAPGITLDCPYCGKETEAARQVCSHCHMEL